jgi:hypothetical protein
MASSCHCDRGFVCEEHPNLPADHDGCRSEGVRCANPGCPWWKGEHPAALDDAVFFDGGRVVTLPEKTAAMLKAAGPLRWRRARES